MPKINFIWGQMFLTNKTKMLTGKHKLLSVLARSVNSPHDYIKIMGSLVGKLSDRNC